MDKTLVFEFFNTVQHAVVASVNSKGQAEAATVGFGHDKDLHLIFGTDKTTRKAKNIAKNPRVALVMNGPDKTVQYEGLAKVVKGPKLEELKKLFYTKLPSAQKYEDLPNQIYFQVLPIWIRYTDHTTTPGNVIEIKLS